MSERSITPEAARRLGLEATDREVLLSLQSAPPPMLAQNPAFQTDGKLEVLDEPADPPLAVLHHSGEQLTPRFDTSVQSV